MSHSALHQHFRAATAMSPLQCQKQIRQQEAHRLMLSEAQAAQAAAFQVGYDTPSQFSREYARAFGASPRAMRLDCERLNSSRETAGL